MDCTEDTKGVIRKSSVKQSKGNGNKYDSFKEAFSRIKQALADGWYFEAVTPTELSAVWSASSGYSASGAAD